MVSMSLYSIAQLLWYLLSGGLYSVSNYESYNLYKNDIGDFIHSLIPYSYLHIVIFVDIQGMMTSATTIGR